MAVYKISTAEFVEKYIPEEHILLDVRTKAEVDAGKIGANILHLDFYARNFKEELAKLDKSKIYFVYCRSGNRSSDVLELMDQLEFKEVYEIQGGVLSWVGGGKGLV